MSFTRRTFLKIGGLTIAGALLKPAYTLLSAPLASVATTPTAKRWAMFVELRACLQKERCTDCIDVCHKLHNVPRFQNVKDEIKWIWTSPFKETFPEQVHQYTKQAVRQQPVLVLCNHCDNPPCVPVCPTKATFKREDGIVVMDYHRCIGCRYCMAACPYGARSFNWKDPRPALKEINQAFPTRTKGVVEKCNFCDERLAKGLLPACIEACKDKGLHFGDLNDPGSELRKILETRYVLQRKPSLGTRPSVYYLV
jgi:Fe-S-cluster-containing dehydrogenase component